MDQQSESTLKNYNESSFTQQLPQQHNKYAQFHVPIRKILSAIHEESIIKVVSRKGDITTQLYKCKLQYLTAYNYTYAVHLSGLLGREFDLTAQILPLPTGDQKEINQYEMNGRQIVYRFDIYEKNYTNKGGQQEKQEEPLLKLLHVHFTQPQLRELMVSYQKNITSEAYKQMTEKILIEQRHNIVQKDICKSSLDKQKSKSIINRQQQSFKFNLNVNDREQQLTILLFEVNMLFSLHLKQYYLYHQFQQCGDRFVEMLKKTVEKYPWFRESQNQ